MKTQYDRIAALLTRKQGCTSVDIVKIGSVCPHKRLSVMKGRGWKISKKQDGKLIRYTGKPPKVKT